MHVTTTVVTFRKFSYDGARPHLRGFIGRESIGCGTGVARALGIRRPADGDRYRIRVSDEKPTEGVFKVMDVIPNPYWDEVRFCHVQTPRGYGLIGIYGYTHERAATHPVSKHFPLPGRYYVTAEKI